MFNKVDHNGQIPAVFRPLLTIFKEQYSDQCRLYLDVHCILGCAQKLVTFSLRFGCLKNVSISYRSK
ncbi:hypothetical protein ACR780_14750 [Sphingobacterium faecium]